MGFEELKKLSPAERLKKLKELEKEKKKEIEEAQKLISSSEEELASEEKKKQDIPIEQLKADDAGVLFGQEEKELFETKRFVQLNKKKEKEKKAKEEKKEETLEEEVKTARVQRKTAERPYGTGDFHPGMSGYEATTTSVTDLYAEIKNLYDTTRIADIFRPTHTYERADIGDLRRAPHQFTDEQRKELYRLEEEATAKQQAIEEGSYTTSQAVKEKLDLATRIIKYMR
ncbi:hypothetical protein J4410_03270 [Candidatus Woesearchaeota archaeon]|nr:hypothetical protein [Candidatus Woesearchaeota archaeon]